VQFLARFSLAIDSRKQKNSSKGEVEMKFAEYKKQTKEQKEIAKEHWQVEGSITNAAIFAAKLGPMNEVHLYEWLLATIKQELYGNK